MPTVEIHVPLRLEYASLGHGDANRCRNSATPWSDPELFATPWERLVLRVMCPSIYSILN